MAELICGAAVVVLASARTAAVDIVGGRMEVVVAGEIVSFLAGEASVVVVVVVVVVVTQGNCLMVARLLGLSMRNLFRGI